MSNDDSGEHRGNLRESGTCEAAAPSDVEASEGAALLDAVAALVILTRLRARKVVST